MTIEEAAAKIKKGCINYGGDTPTRTVRFALGISAHYAHKLGYTQEEVLSAIESKRTYSAPNYYQAAKFPRLSKNIHIYDSLDHLKVSLKDHKFRCPLCKGLSLDWEACDTKLPAKTKSGICDWKAYGFFGTLGKGYSFVVKKEFLNFPKVYVIFQPVRPDGTEL